MSPLYKHGFSTENKNKILSINKKKLIQQTNGTSKSVAVRTVYNSKKMKITMSHYKTLEI